MSQDDLYICGRTAIPQSMHNSQGLPAKQLYNSYFMGQTILRWLVVSITSQVMHSTHYTVALPQQ